MMKGFKIIVLTGSAWLLLGLVPSFGSAKPQCGNFLKLLSKQPKDLLFLQCKSSHDAQIRVLEATYRVSGAHAAKVESYFIKHTKMSKLVFHCCIWETWSDTTAQRYGRD
jgi:hypothetical protein